MGIKKTIIVKDFETEKILEKIEVVGGYNITWSKDAEGTIGRLRQMENGKLLGDSLLISNHLYRPIAEALKKKFEDLSHVLLDFVLFVENTTWEPKGAASPWKAKIVTAGKYLEYLTGYHYIIEIRRYYIEKMSRNQVAALVYQQLRRINSGDGLDNFDLQDWSNMVATLGRDWDDTKGEIDDILGDEFEGWNQLKPAGRQLGLFDSRKVQKKEDEETAELPWGDNVTPIRTEEDRQHIGV